MRTWMVTTAAVVMSFTACSREPAIDWSAPENFFYREESSNVDNAVKLVYSALVDVPADANYKALADVEHYMDFVDGVDRTQLVAQQGNTKTVQIAQRVIGRQNN